MRYFFHKFHKVFLKSSIEWINAKKVYGIDRVMGPSSSPYE